MRGACLCAAAVALTLGASASAADGAASPSANDLDAARPAAVIAVPFAQIAKLAPELRMYHVVVRDPKGRVAARADH